MHVSVQPSGLSLYHLLGSLSLKEKEPNRYPITLGPKVILVVFPLRFLPYSYEELNDVQNIWFFEPPHQDLTHGETPKSPLQLLMATKQGLSKCSGHQSSKYRRENLDINRHMGSSSLARKGTDNLLVCALSHLMTPYCCKQISCIISRRRIQKRRTCGRKISKSALSASLPRILTTKLSQFEFFVF